MTDPGWYPDPQAPGSQRYWDGANWTEHTAPGGPVAAPPPPGPGGPGGPGWVQQGYGYHQGVATPPKAGFWIRFLAALVDGLIIGLPLSLLIRDQATRNGIQLIVGVLYFGFLEGGATGQTLGKRLCGLRVVDAGTGQPGVGVGRGIGRYFARWLSAIPLLLGYFWMLWDANRQTWHDKLTNVVVVKA